MKANIKKKVNLILSVRINFLYLFSKFIFIFSCFNSIIISCVNDKFFINVSINFPINVEYNVWGIWYNILNSKNCNSKKLLQLKKEKINKNNNLSSKKILERKEFEINSLNYHLALKIDRS